MSSPFRLLAASLHRPGHGRALAEPPGADGPGVSRNTPPRPARALPSRGWFLLLALLWTLGMAACGRPSRQAPTPLPPGTPLPQPTPAFKGSTPPPGTGPAPSLSPEEALRSRLATAVAERARAGTPLPSATRVPDTPDARGQGRALVRPTALGIVEAGGATLSATPGGAPLATLEAGDTVTLTGISPDGGWYAAFRADGTAGWIEAQRVRVFGQEERLETVEDAVVPGMVATLMAELHRALTLPAGEATMPAEEAGPPPPSPTSPLPKSPTPVVAVVQVERLNIRGGPGTDHPVVGQVGQGARLMVQARNPAGDWLQVRVPDVLEGLGWVYGPLVAVQGELERLPVLQGKGDPTPSSAPGVREEGFGGPERPRGSLVFQARNGGTIYRYDLETGELRELTWGMDPAIGPDGRTVAFVRGGGEAGIYLMDTGGGRPRRIFGGNAPRTPTWSPDGGWIVFSQVVGSTTCYEIGFGVCLPSPPPNLPARAVQREIRALARIDVEGTNYQDLPSLSGAIAPAWGPQGLVYQSDAGLQLVPQGPEGQTQPLLADPRFRDPDVRADGRLVFASDEGGHWEIFVAEADGSRATPLTRPPGLGEQPHNVAPAWSPDGRWIVFLSNRGGPWRLWLMAADGSGARPLPVDVALDYAFQAEQAVDWGP